MRKSALAVVLCLAVSYATLCFAADYPVNKDLYFELLSVVNAQADTMAAFDKAVLDKKQNFTLGELAVVKLADDKIAGVQTGLMGVATMLKMEYLHADENQKNAKAAKEIAKYIDEVLSTINADTKQFEADFNSGTLIFMQARFETYLAYLRQAGELLKSISLELNKA